jgi:RNA polymerase sigma-70 factor (ECF subfamily)
MADLDSQFDPTSRFIEAFTESQAALRGFCMASVNHRQDSQDVFQKTCLILWKKSDQWDPTTPFLPWAFAVARYEVLAYIRTRARERLVFDDDIVIAMAGTGARIADKQCDRLDAMQACVQALKPEHQQLLSDYYVKGYTFKEIAERSGRSLGAVKVMTMRLRQSLGASIKARLAQPSASLEVSS